MNQVCGCTNKEQGPAAGDGFRTPLVNCSWMADDKAPYLVPLGNNLEAYTTYTRLIGPLLG